MPIDIQLSFPSSGPDRTAAWTLAATIGLFFAAIAQALVAWKQARAANQQAAAAQEQASAAKQQVATANHQFELAAMQLTQSLVSADNATMPLLGISPVQSDRTHLHLRLDNQGLGPALHVQIGRFDPEKKRMVPNESGDVNFIGAGRHLEMGASLQDLAADGVVVYAQSSHRTEIERLVKYDGDDLIVGPPRLFRVYNNVLNQGHSPKTK